MDKQAIFLEITATIATMTLTAAATMTTMMTITVIDDNVVAIITVQ